MTLSPDEAAMAWFVLGLISLVQIYRPDADEIPHAYLVRRKP